MTDTQLAGIPASTAGPGEWRQAQIIRLLEDHFTRYDRVTGWGARYVIEGHVLDATPEDWAFAEAYVANHRDDLAALPVLSPDSIRERDVANSKHHDDAAAAAVMAGDFDLAEYLISAAEWYLPKETGHWAGRREIIARHRAAFAAPVR